MPCNAMKLLQAMFGKAPEALNAVDVVRATGKLIHAVIDSIVLGVAERQRVRRSHASRHYG